MLKKAPNIVLLGHGNIAQAVASQLQIQQGKQVFAIFGTQGGKLITPISNSQEFLSLPKDERRTGFSDKLLLDTMLDDLGYDNVIVVDASSNPDPDAHSTLFKKGFRIVSANKNPLGLGDSVIAMQMLASDRYGGEPTVMAGQGALNFIGEECLDPTSTGPIESIVQLDLIGSGTLSGIAQDLALGTSYSEAIRAAIKRCDTEPNPNYDMDGKDLAKKLVILARKAGYNVTIDNVKFGDGFLGSEFRTEFEGEDWGTKDEETDTQKAFITKIAHEKDTEMADLIKNKEPLVPRYVGRMIKKQGGRVDLSVGIEFVSADSEHCAAKFNKLIMTIDRGHGASTDIRTLSGRGAGPVQTAQGIIKAMNKVMNSF